ncbi:MAG: hypothetical protein ACI4PF_05320 [Christensenellales bacterium]
MKVNFQTINAARNNINFEGYELFALDGVVKNGDEVVPFAEIEVISKAGVFKTISNAFGAFSLPRLAGEVTLTAYHESISLFSQTFDKSKSELVVTGTTSLSGKINSDSREDCDFILKLNDQVVSINEDLTFNIEGVEPNAILTLESENYYIDCEKVVVSIENGVFVFNAEKYYDISGSVLSGTTPLNNARIVAGNVKTYSNSLGEFSIYKQHGNILLNVSLQGFIFESMPISYESSNVEFIGKFNLNGKVYTDDNILNNIEIVSENIRNSTNIKGEFTLNGIQLGDTIYVNNANYFVENNNLVVSNTSSITFNLKRIYTLTIDVSYLNTPLENVTAIVNKRSYVSNGEGKIIITSLYGSNPIELSLEGFRFENLYSSDYLNSYLNITPDKYYNLNGKIKSDDLVISNAKITTGDIEVYSNELGEFEINNLYTLGTLRVECEGYNTKEVSYSIENNDLQINLTYDIVGKINCGTTLVGNVKVSLNYNSIYSNYLGEFAFKGVSGTNTLTFEKEFYSFSDVDVTSGQLTQVYCTYSISGKASNKMGVIIGLNIKLVRNSNETETLTDITDEKGEFSFENLTGEYLLIYDTDYSENLLPTGYTVDGGGIFNFSDCGYKIKGRVMTGDVPVSGVTVRAGDLVATTNNQGYYKFDLIINDETLVLSKDGYTFLNNNFPIDLSYDEREDVDFQCTYSIEGVVASGDTNLDNVKITIGDLECYTNNDGYYTLNGLSGSVTITAELGNYKFIIPSVINSTGEYNITATFDTNIKISTLNIPVADMDIMINGNTFTTDENGEALVTDIQIGDTLTFNKQGFAINSYTFNQNEDKVELNATYKVQGRVYITTRELSGVRVSSGNLISITDERGYFEFTGLEGENTLSFVKDNYTFDTVTLNGYEYVTILAKYSVSGNVSVAGAGLENVTIKAGNTTVYTDQLGNYSISNLQDEVTLIIEKYGYEFDGQYIVNAPAVINIEATYRIAGKVVSGDIDIDSAEIKLSNGVTLFTDENGYFETKGIEEVINIEVIASGYNNAVLNNVDKFNNNIVFNLTYTATINLTNITNLTDVTISVGESTDNYSTSQIVFENLSGEQKITIYKDGYNFNPSEIVVTKESNISIVVKKEFQVSGTILTTNNIPVSGVTITAGGKETTTDNNGQYLLSPFIDPVQIKLVMKVIDTAYNGENYEYSVNIDQVSTDAIKNFTLDESQYAYYLFKRGYQNLNDALTYQIFGTGTVVDSTSGESQDVKIVYKKDSKNQRIIQNLNWFDGKIAGIVDPRIAQLTYVDMGTKSVKYQTITGTNVSQDTANWTTSWTQTDYSSYLNNYGVNAEGYYPYVINQNTISTTSNITLTDNLYTFTFGLATTEAMYSYYVIQMSKMCSSQTFESFLNCNLTYTIGQDGYIRSLTISEQYKVKASFLNPTVTGNITYNFLTTSSNEMINDIKISTVDEIKASLSRETPTISINSSKILDYDLYCEKRRILL